MKLCFKKINPASRAWFYYRTKTTSPWHWYHEFCFDQLVENVVDDVLDPMLDLITKLNTRGKRLFKKELRALSKASKKLINTESTKLDTKKDKFKENGAENHGTQFKYALYFYEEISQINKYIKKGFSKKLDKVISLLKKLPEDFSFENIIKTDISFSLKYSNFMTLLHKACSDGNTDVAKSLIEKYANIDAQDNDGRTPLHRACYDGNEDVADFLIVNGANIDAKDNNGRTPLH